MPEGQNPMKDIVLPLAVVIGLVGNALFVGIAWGRLTMRQEAAETRLGSAEGRLNGLADKHDALRDKVRDLERDAEEDRKDFRLLEDYTRGRIDRLPYNAPSSRRQGG